ncbi:MAG: hypothetical protein PHP82_04085 [Candidatus ainarchaeum sp.]|nr:hypothetical protein [Candidatus ainarchaeum sp.]
MYELNFLFSLIITLIIEIFVLILLIKKIFKITKISITKIIFVGFIASFATMPYLWFVIPTFLLNRIQFIIIGELIVFLVELLIYNQFLELSLKKSAIISLICNLSSIIIGLIINI